MNHIRIELVRLWNQIKTSKNWQLFLGIGVVAIVLLNLMALVKVLLAIVALISLVYALILAWPILEKKLK